VIRVNNVLQTLYPGRIDSKFYLSITGPRVHPHPHWNIPPDDDD